MTSLLTRMQRHHRRYLRSTDAVALVVEHRVGSASLCGNLGTHPLRGQHCPAAGTSGAGAGHCTVGDFSFGLRLEYLELHSGWNAVGTHYVGTQCPFPLGLPAQPHGSHQWNFSAAVGGLAAHGACPEVRDGSGRHPGPWDTGRRVPPLLGPLSSRQPSVVRLQDPVRAAVCPPASP